MENIQINHCIIHKNEFKVRNKNVKCLEENRGYLYDIQKMKNFLRCKKQLPKNWINLTKN